MGSTTAVKLKLHRRNLELDGERYSVLALRPTTTERFATTEYHDTSHILCNLDGADLLGRLAWAMAFQSRKRTLLLVDLPQIVKDPFGTGPTAPILVVNTDLDPPGPATIESLCGKLPLTEPSEGSVRLMTAGFDRALADPERFWNQERNEDPAFKAHQHRAGSSRSTVPSCSPGHPRCCASGRSGWRSSSRAVHSTRSGRRSTSTSGPARSRCSPVPSRDRAGVIVDVLGLGAAVIFAAISVLHVTWAFGSAGVGAAVIPTVDGKPTMEPSTTATLIVAFLLALSAFILVGAVVGLEPTWLFRLGAAGIAVVLLARAIGDRRQVGFFKRVRDTPFARNDTRFFSPLCLGLSVASALVAITA